MNVLGLNICCVEQEQRKQRELKKKRLYLLLPAL